MTARFVGGILAAILLLATAATARADATSDACWQLVYHALEANATSPHAPFIRYSEGIDITEDGHYYEQAHADIVYRDDGIAYIDDNRWVHPFLSTALEPGPPLLGPYGSHRESWISLTTPPPPDGLEVIASTHNEPLGRCVDAGDETLDNRTVAHLELLDSGRKSPGLKELWLDRSSLAVRRAIVSQYLVFLTDYDGHRQQRLIDYTIHVQRVNGFSVLSEVDWRYRFRTYMQWSEIDARYTFGSFHFDTKPPLESMFASSG